MDFLRGADSFPFFHAFFAFLFLSFFVLFIFYVLSPVYLLEMFWPQPFKKPINGTLINQVSTRPIFPPILHPQLATFSSNRSARIWSIFKTDTRMDGYVLAALAAYQSNVVSSENDDVTCGLMSPDSNVGKIRLLTGKS